MWLAKADALIRSTKDIILGSEFGAALSNFAASDGTRRRAAGNSVTLILLRALAAAELNAPASAQGSYIAAGNVFDALAAVAKVLSGCLTEVMIIDPYMDEKTVAGICPLAPAGVAIKLLADAFNSKPGLKPAASAWVQQFGTVRPLEIRLARSRSLHDRLIIVDNAQPFLVSQSLNALAARSTASIIRVDDQEGRELKVAAYSQLWNEATPLT